MEKIQKENLIEEEKINLLFYKSMKNAIDKGLHIQNIAPYWYAQNTNISYKAGAIYSIKNLDKFIKTEKGKVIYA